ncbi:MAG: hypothetical protein IPM57_06275 [Oligoflexia bacterium]|nr:hypothetical protein [Oligoflexia bacterium]
MSNLIFSAIILFSLNLKADIFDLPKVQTVANKKYGVSNEITAKFDYLPKDPFSKYVAIGASYSHAFSDFTTWEIINASYVLELASGLKKSLVEEF